MEQSINIKIPFPGWEYVRKVGNGGFGSVYEIQRKQFDFIEKSAMKVISIPRDPSVIAEDRNDGYDEESIRRKYNEYLKAVVSEYKLMQELHGHSNIVDCQDMYYEEHKGTIGWDVYIRMELLTPLNEITNRGNLPEMTVIALGKDICRALVACEKKNIVHRDIKPENIMASSFGFKLGDFGIARTLDHTTYATIAGTERYMAPEVIKREKYGREVDIYSLGLVLYWLLNNRRMPFCPQGTRPPMAADMNEAQIKRIQGVPLPAPVNGSMGLRRIVLKACAYRPEDRYSSAREMLDALEGLNMKAASDTDTSKSSSATFTAQSMAENKERADQNKVKKEKQTNTSFTQTAANNYKAVRDTIAANSGAGAGKASSDKSRASGQAKPPVQKKEEDGSGFLLKSWMDGPQPLKAIAYIIYFIEMFVGLVFPCCLGLLLGYLPIFENNIESWSGSVIVLVMFGSGVIIHCVGAAIKKHGYGKVILWYGRLYFIFVIGAFAFAALRGPLTFY